jgi:hypothetical protein
VYNVTLAVLSNSIAELLINMRGEPLLQPGRYSDNLTGESSSEPTISHPMNTVQISTFAPTIRFPLRSRSFRPDQPVPGLVPPRLNRPVLKSDPACNGRSFRPDQEMKQARNRLPPFPRPRTKPYLVPYGLIPAHSRSRGAGGACGGRREARRRARRGDGAAHP